MIESGQLQVLMAVNKSASLSEAADSLNITQSAVSQNLKTIEAKVGFPVVTRKGKKVVLTPAGVRLAKLGRNYLKKLDDAIVDILQEQNKISGSLRIGTLFGIGKSWVANRLTEFSLKYPELLVDIRMDFPNKLLNLFEKYELDILVIPEKLIPVYAENKILHSESCTLVFPQSNDFQITPGITLKELCEYPLVFFEEKDPLFFHWCRSMFGAIPRNTRARLIVNSFGQMLKAVNDGIGIAVVPTHVFRRSQYKSTLRTFGKENDVSSSEFHLVFHSEDKDNLKTQTVYDFLSDEVKNLDVE